MAYDPTEECDFLKNELEKDHNVPDSFTDKINYRIELYSIMHAFGDVKKPLESSVMLMHDILQNQMALLIKNAENIRKLRKGNKISHQDVLFLMRKNKVLLKRLFQFLFVEDAKSRLLSTINKIGDEFLPENGERVSKCLRYLGFIEKFTGDLTLILKDKNIVDHTNQKRLKRKDLMANSMTQEEYKRFYEYTARVTFCYKSTIERYKSWLQQCSCIKVDITNLALSIFHFLSRETVARIVDKALEIKSRKHEKSANFSFENCTYPEDMLLELRHDLDKSENNHSLSRSEDCFQIDELETDLQPCSHSVPRDTSNIKNYKMGFFCTYPSKENKFHEDNSDNNNNSPYSMQKMNSIPSASHDSDDMINCPISVHTRKKNRILEKNVTKPKRDIVAFSSHLDQNGFLENSDNSKSNFNYPSKRKLSNQFSIFNENLNVDAETSERNFNMYDNFELKKDCFLNTYCVVEEDESLRGSSKCETNRVSSNALLHFPDASKNINKESYFSLNFQDKALSICYDGSKTFEFNSNSANKLTINTEDTVLTSSYSVEIKVESNSEDIKTEDSYLKHLVDDFDKSINHIQFTAPIKMKSKVHWFPGEPITPEEIQAAFIHYQHPSPLSHLMKTGFSYLRQRKTNLVCLAVSD